MWSVILDSDFSPKYFTDLGEALTFAESPACVTLQKAKIK